MENANVKVINPVIESFNQENAFDGKDIHAQVVFFNETLLNIFSNFISNRIKTFTESDPPWMTKDIKNKIKLKKTFYRKYMRYQNTNQQSSENNIITKSKEKYYQLINAKLNYPSISNKTSWSILKTFYNSKKIRIIPLLFINNKVLTDC